MLDAARVNNHRAGDDGDAAAGLLHLAHHLRNARDTSFDPPFRRHVVAHEREPETVTFTELRRHADAIMAADDGVASLDVAQFAAFGVPAGCDDHGIHPLFLDFHPFALQPD